MELMKPLDMVHKNLRPGKMVDSGFLHLQDRQDLLAQRAAKSKEMYGPVRRQGLIDVGNLRVDQKPLAFGDNGTLIIYDKFSPAPDAVEPLITGHPMGAADGLLAMVDADQVEGKRESVLVRGIVDLENHGGHL